MSVNSGGDAAVEEVGQNTNMAGAIEAAKINAANAEASKVVVGQVEAETQNAHGQEQAAKHKANAAGNLGFDSSPRSSASADSSGLKAKGSTEGDVYGNMLTNKVASLEMASSLYTLATDGTDSAGGFSNTFDKDIKSMLKKEPGFHKTDLGESTTASTGKSTISTSRAFGLVSKTNLAGGALNGDTGNTNTWSMGKSSSELTQKLTLTKAKNFKLEQGAANAIRKQAELGGQAFVAQQKFGMGSSVTQKLVKEMHLKPSEGLGSEPVEKDTTTSWA